MWIITSMRWKLRVHSEPRALDRPTNQPNEWLVQGSMWMKGLPEPSWALGADWNFFLCSMAVEGFHIPDPQIKLLPSDGLQLSITSASIKISGRWKYRKNIL